MMRGWVILRRCITELVRLFVDDGRHTALIVGWIATACWLPRLIGIEGSSGLVLFAGLAVIFVATTRGPAVKRAASKV